MNPVARYWDTGVEHVPFMTGALHVMDASDLQSLATDFRFALPLTNVLDVGCGTGRISKHCAGYTGVDISRDAVAYCRSVDIVATVIDGPDDLEFAAVYKFDWVTCMSVFTHIPATERVRYLGRFKRLAPKLLADVIPGDGTGDVSMWTADTNLFEESLLATGYQVFGVADRQAAAGDYVHRYYYARAA